MDAQVTPEQRALRDAYLSEMWPTCREESREDRAVKRALDAAFAQPVDSDLHIFTGTESGGMDAECA